MKTYNFSVFKDRIKPLSPTKGVSGNTNFYECTFEFSEDWDSLAAFAVFVGEGAYPAGIDDGKCIVPHEVLEESGEIYIGVYATNGEDNLLRISTNLIPFEVEEGAFREGNLPIAPSPDVWETYIAAMNKTLIDTKDARDAAKGHSDVAKASATDSTLSAYAASESADRAAQSESNANTSKEFAEGYADDAEGYSKAAKDEVENAKAEVKKARAEVTKAEGFASEAATSSYNASMHEANTEGYKTEAVNAMANAITSADEARINKEGAEKAYNDTLAETENLVHKDNAEEIHGVKNFTNGIKTARITSDGALELKTLDNPLTIYANGEYMFYDGTIYIDGKSIFSVFDNIDELTVGKILGKDGYFQIETDGMEIDSQSAVYIRSATAVSLDGDVYINDEVPASIKYVNEALKDIGGGSITIDDTPTSGSKNAVSSGGTYIELSRLNNSLTDAKADISNLITNKAEKSYVDSSIQQALLDSWEVEV